MSEISEPTPPIADRVYELAPAFWKAKLLRSLRTSAHPLLVVDSRGREIERSDGLRRRLSAFPDSTAVERDLQDVSRAICEVQRERSNVATSPPGGPNPPLWTQGPYSVRTMELEAGLLDPDPTYVLAFDRLPVRGEKDRPLAERYGLTPRQAAAAHLLARGLSNKTIAARLDISRHTARHHTAEVLTKLGVDSRARAAAILTRDLTAASDASGVE